MRVAMDPVTGISEGDIIENKNFPGRLFKVEEVWHYPISGVTHLYVRDDSRSSWSFDSSVCSKSTTGKFCLGCSSSVCKCFDLLPIGEDKDQKTPVDKASACSYDRHEENEVPMRLAEKGFEAWYFCKVCGKATRSVTEPKPERTGWNF